MPRTLVESIVAAVRLERWLDEPDRRCWAYDERTVVVDFKVADRWAALDLRVDDGVTIFLVAGGGRLSRHFRGVLLGRAPIVTDPSLRHRLEQWPASVSPAEVARCAGEWVAWLTRNAETVPSEFHPDLPLTDSHVSVYWWDDRSNFGDALGPWMVQRLSGRAAVNGKRVAPQERTLATIGSIVGHLERDSVDVWGSGLQRPLRDESLAALRRMGDVRVHAVRGPNTRQELVDKLGWDVPEVYGDPAVLMPQLYQPRPAAASAGKVTLVAHSRHVEHFQNTDTGHVHRVDVRRSPEQVVDEIASSTACVSSSLHGVAIAQAYGVPWVWLKIADRGLRGGRFKFDDYFSVLDRSQVSALRVETADELQDLPLASVAKDAALPEYTTSFEPLLDAFPLARA